MTNNPNNYIDVLNQLFETKLSECLKQSRFSKNKKILKYTSAFYRQFYYSTLLNDTLLSPANLIYSICDDASSKVLSVPAVTLKSKTISQGFNFKMTDYSLDNHPIVSDLKILVDFISPDVALSDSDLFKDATLNKILPLLSLYDPFYVEYLLILGVQLDLIEKMPSICVNRACVSKQAEQFFKSSPREIFELIVERSAELTCELIRQVLYVPQAVFSKDYVLSLLKKPQLTDDIFKKFFISMGINIEAVWDTSQNDTIITDEFDEALMTTSFVLGILIDKYFFSIYGYFLKLIQPLYTLNVSFGKNLSFVRTVSYDDFTTALHSPCSTYSITKLGMEYFGLEIDPQENNLINSSIPIDMLLTTVLNKAGEKSLHTPNTQKTNKFCNEVSETIYSFKVKLLDYPEYWKNIEIPAIMSLHKLHEFISDEFELEPSTDYVFFMDETENPFLKYSSYNTKRRTQKSTDETLDSFNLEKGKKFSYILNNSFTPFDFNLLNLNYKSIKLSIEVLKIIKPMGYEIYPQVSRMSKAFKDTYDNENLFF